jgi:hypothetical protein
VASKRTINRLYWVTVKEVALNGRACSSYREIYPDALAGQPDRVIRPRLERLEETYGRRNTQRDLNDPNLWPARQIVDGLRR